MARARWLWGALATTVLAACAAEGPTAPSAAQVPLVIRATILAQTLAGRRIDIDVGYRRTGGDRVALEVTPSSIPIDGATRQVPVTVTIEPCLRDAQRLNAAQPGCPLDIVLRLRAEGGAVEDTVRITPSENALPGATLSPPSAQLFGAYGVTVRGVTGATGTGAIISQPAGLSCAISGATTSGQCTASFSGRNPVRLIATAVPGSDFAGWGTTSGCPAGTADCVLTLTGAVTVTPSFSQRRLPLSVAVGGAGRGTVAVTTAEAASNFVCTTGASVQSCTRDLIIGATAQLAAQPATGNRFTGWGGACSGTGACSVTMSSAQAVTANFSVDSVTLAVRTVGQGRVRSTPLGIDCTDNTGLCSAGFPVGTQFALAAEPAAGFRFVGWSGACTGTATCNVTLATAQTVTATFEPITSLVTVTVTGEGVVSSDPVGINCTSVGTGCTGNFALNSTVTLTAIENRGSGRFAGWSGACANTVGITCRVTITGALTVGARFDRVNTITVVNGGTGAGRITESTTGTACTFPGSTCTIVVVPGTRLVFTAVPDGGSRLNGWAGLSSDCAPTATVCAVTPPAAGTLTVTFERVLPTLVLTPRTVTFVDTLGRPLPPARTIGVTTLNGPLPTLSIAGVEYVAPATPFLSISALSGPAPQQFQITPVQTSLGAGTYTARVLVAAPGAANAVDTVFVTRTIVAPLPSVWRFERSTGATDTLRAVSGFSATDQMAVGYRLGGLTMRAVRFNGANWATVDAVGNPARAAAYGVTAVPNGSYIAATDSLVYRYVGGLNNNLWVREGQPQFTLDEPYRGIHAASATGVFAVGGGSNLRSNRFDGSQWRVFEVSSLEGTLNGVWAFSQTSAIAVGRAAVWGRFAFGIWTTGLLPSSIEPDMHGIWADSPNFVIAVGQSGTIFRYDGSTWTEMNSGTTRTLRAVYGTSPSNIIAVGDNGTILRYNGTAWQAMASPVTTALYGIWLSDANNGVAVGANGVILRYAAP